MGSKFGWLLELKNIVEKVVEIERLGRGKREALMLIRDSKLLIQQLFIKIIYPKVNFAADNFELDRRWEAFEGLMLFFDDRFMVAHPSLFA